MIVVISQSSANQPKLREFEEELVTHLLLEAGCEVNLVPDLEHLGSESTGLLCLEGIRGSMVLASWHPAAEAHRLLASHGIHGKLVSRDAEVTSPPLDPDKKLGPGVYDAMQRTIHHLQLNLENTIEDYSTRVSAIGQESRVQTISISGPTQEPPPAVGQAETTPAEIPSPAEADPALETPPSTVAPVPKRSEQQLTPTEEDESLDALIDQLDEFSL